MAWGTADLKLPLDPKSHLIQLIPNVLALWPRPVDWIVVEPRYDVPVSVIDCLTGGAAVVHDDIETASASRNRNCLAQVRQERPEMRGELVGQLGHSDVMRFRQKQSVARVDWMDIQECQALYRLKDFG
jgi:hypothetical protein